MDVFIMGHSSMTAFCACECAFVLCHLIKYFAGFFLAHFYFGCFVAYNWFFLFDYFEICPITMLCLKIVYVIC